LLFFPAVARTTICSPLLTVAQVVGAVNTGLAAISLASHSLEGPTTNWANLLNEHLTPDYEGFPHARTAHRYEDYKTSERQRAMPPVLDAYGWPPDLSDDGDLERLPVLRISGRGPRERRLTLQRFSLVNVSA
jgi:hypothetical protein